jgi:hypothetical protein
MTESIMHYGLLRDGCELMGRNVADLLKLAGEPVTAAGVKAIIRSLPTSREQLKDEEWRRSPCSRTMELAFERSRGTGERIRYLHLYEYFLHYLPDRSCTGLHPVSAAFLGVLAIEFDHAPCEETKPPIHFQCQVCGKEFDVDPGLAGKTARCKGCGDILTFPEVA